MSLRDEIARLFNKAAAEIDSNGISARWQPFEYADAVLALLRDGKWFDEAVERMDAYDLAPYPKSIYMEAAVATVHAANERRLRAALGGTE
jgi:hypothetical protein